jgi:PIN domain nuclease of toxin-antitoxin system
LTAASRAGLRASAAGIRLPDALVIATADVLAARDVLTTDRRWRKSSKRVRAI